MEQDIINQEATEQEPKKRTRRTISKEEKIQKFQEEIAKYEAKIAEAKKKIDELEKPSTNLRDITAKIKELGLSPDDVMKAVEKLGSKK